MKKVKLRMDGYIIEAKEGDTILEAALKAGIYIPHLCHHPDLEPIGNCKLCTVEVEGEPIPIQSCEKTIKDGMVIKTQTEAVKKLRQTALELMLASHPQDCTSCNKYLNCELQALMQYLGVTHSRLRHIEKKNTSLVKSDVLIKREMQRCIHCYRCIRACNELRGAKALSINKKNGEVYVGFLNDSSLMESSCRGCSACVEVCPTGAIQDVEGIFSIQTPRQISLVPCKNQCPTQTDIPLYIRLAQEGRYSDAVSVIREKLTFPHSLGYICNHQCETNCKRSYINDSIAIRDIKRFTVENDLEEKWREKTVQREKNGKKIGIIGGGPTGMTAAYYLAKLGYELEVYERMPNPGGMLSYGIPKYRLPQKIVNKELEIIIETGMKLFNNTAITSLDQLKGKGYDAILLAIGASKGRRPVEYNKIWPNAIDAVDFCRMSCEENLPELGENVTIYGGGNVAFDCARIAKKLGVKNVRIICMEARSQMLADTYEITEALKENIEILNQMAIVHVNESEGKLDSLKVTAIKNFKFTANELEFEAINGTEDALDTNTLVFATGQQPDLTETFGIELIKSVFPKVDENLQTSIKGVFAAGDVLHGTKSVVQAIASGRKAATCIDKYLGGHGNIEEVLFKRDPNPSYIGSIQGFFQLERISELKNSEDLCEEAKRCLQCDLRLDIQKAKYWVDPQFKTIRGVKR